MGTIVTRTKKLRRARFTTQILALAFLNLPFLSLRYICSPVFYCHSCPLATMACPLGVLVNFTTLGIIPFVTLGVLGISGIIGGRIICGWLCPFGFLQDLLHKIKTKKFTIPRYLSYTKYAVMVGLVFAVPFFWPGSPYTFCDFCPSATLESTIPWAFMGVSSGFGVRFFTRMAILLGVLVFAVLVYRGFCRMFCPLGAIFSLFNKFSLFRLDLAFENCNNCGGCRKICGIDSDPVENLNDKDCIRCLDCTATKHINIGVK